MKKSKAFSGIQKQTNPLLLKAWSVISAYTKATGAHFGIVDHNYTAIPEVFSENTTEKNICLYCMKHRLNMAVSNNQDFNFCPCRELHIESIKKAVAREGSSTYTCDLGFVFWTSPIFSGNHFIGALIASGYLYNDKDETIEKMFLLGKDSISKEELRELLSSFTRINKQQTSALADLMLLCAESLSQDHGNYHATLKRRGNQQKELDAELKKLQQNYPNGIPAPEYPLDREQAFLEAVRWGNTEKAHRILIEILGLLVFTNSGQFRVIQVRALEMAILLFRIENDFSGVSNTFSRITHHFMNSLEKAETLEELTDTLHLITQHMAKQAFSFQGIRHVSALKKADQYIQENFSRKVSLNEIAAASGLSAPYFSTIFKKEMGENLSSYLNRLRVEKASRLLMETSAPLSKIANSCGFEDLSWFSRIFKNYTGKNPGKFRTKIKSPETEIPESHLSESFRALAENI